VSVAAYEPSSLLAASYSNFGPSVTVSAPGTVWTPAGVGSYGFAVGTSAAPPLVTGAAALLQALKPRNPLTVKQLLRNTARPLADNALPQGGLDVLQLILAGNLSPLPRDFSGGRLSGGQAFILVPDIGEVPGLAGFLLDYDDDDHHVGRLVAGTFEATPGRAFSTQVLVGYGDDGDDDSFQWAVDRQALPPGTTVHETRQCDVTGGLNWALGPLSGDRVPVLLGFHFLGTERHLKTVEARIMEVAFQSGPYLFAEAQFGDKNPDNRFCVSIAYGLVPADRVVARGELHGTDSGGYDSASFSGNQPVLQGFALEFVNDDHHLDQVGVRLDPRRASVWYNDKNDDDDFKWDIWWVDVR